MSELTDIESSISELEYYIKCFDAIGNMIAVEKQMKEIQIDDFYTQDMDMNIPDEVRAMMNNAVHSGWMHQVKDIGCIALSKAILRYYMAEYPCVARIFECYKDFDVYYPNIYPEILPVFSRIDVASVCVRLAFDKHRFESLKSLTIRCFIEENRSESPVKFGAKLNNLNALPSDEMAKNLMGSKAFHLEETRQAIDNDRHIFLRMFNYREIRDFAINYLNELIERKNKLAQKI